MKGDEQVMRHLPTCPQPVLVNPKKLHNCTQSGQLVGGRIETYLLHQGRATVEPKGGKWSLFTLLSGQCAVSTSAAQSGGRHHLQELPAT